MEIFIQTKKSYEELASQIRDILNVKNTNVSPEIHIQERYGLNIGGGEYFVFEGLGLQVYLIQNQGEVLIEEREEWPFYLYVEEEDAADEFLNTMTSHLSKLLSTAGIQNELDDWGH